MAKAAIKIGIAGCTGRMGQMLIQQVLADKNLQLAGGTVLPKSKEVGQDIGTLLGMKPLGVKATDKAATLISACDVVIDFTSPIYTLELADALNKAGKPHIIGTTGLTAAQEKTLKSLCSKHACVYAANMSVGVNLLLSLVKQAAKALPIDYDIEIVEMHHKHKVDAPSGTALALGKAAAAGRDISLASNAVYTREGNTGARPTGSIGFATLRGGTVVGDHSVIFAGEQERIELTHLAQDRSLFAKGALFAATWAVKQKAGLYSMQDVLGL